MGPSRLNDWGKIVHKIEEGERRIERQHDINRAIQLKVNLPSDIRREGGSSLVIGGSSLVISEEREGPSLVIGGSVPCDIRREGG